MPSNKAAQDKHPRITDPSNTTPNDPQDDKVSAEELAKDPNAADYLADQTTNTDGNDTQDQENKEGDKPTGDAPTAPESNQGTDAPTGDANNDTEPAKEEVKPQVPAIDMKQLSKNGGEGLVALVGLITQMQQQMMELQKQVSNKVDTEKVDPKLFLVSGATANDAARHANKAKRTADFVNSQPRVSIFVPTEGKEKVGQASLPVTINGHRWNVPKGVYVDVPKPVADIVKDSLNQTEAAYVNAFNLDNAPEEKRQALEG